MPIDFNKLREQNRLKIEAARKVAMPNETVSPKPSTTKKEFASDRELLEALLNEDLSDWEKQFTTSVLSWVRKSSGNRPSMKQKAVIDKLSRRFNLDVVESKVPTVDNRYSDGIYRAPHDNYNSAPLTGQFDDYDDDIPF